MGSVLLCECLGLNSDPQPWWQAPLPMFCILCHCITTEHSHHTQANPELIARLCSFTLLLAFANHKSVYCLSTCAFKMDATIQHMAICVCFTKHTVFKASQFYNTQQYAISFL